MHACKQKHIHGIMYIILLLLSYLLHFPGACSNGGTDRRNVFSGNISNITRLPAAIARTYVYNADYSIARAEVHFSARSLLSEIPCRLYELPISMTVDGLNNNNNIYYSYVCSVSYYI